jgi:hypothetical protein
MGNGGAQWNTSQRLLAGTSRVRTLERQERFHQLTDFLHEPAVDSKARTATAQGQQQRKDSNSARTATAQGQQQRKDSNSARTATTQGQQGKAASTSQAHAACLASATAIDASKGETQPCKGFIPPGATMSRQAEEAKQEASQSEADHELAAAIEDLERAKDTDESILDADDAAQEGLGEIPDSSEDDSVDELCLISNNRRPNGASLSGSLREDLAQSIHNSFRRYDEHHSFMTRSQRARLDLQLDAGEDHQHRVKFIDTLVTTHHIDPIPVETHSLYYMGTEDFIRMQQEAEMTAFRWENHLSGKIPFDGENNTLRGLEDVFDKSFDTYRQRAHHQQCVLLEIYRQRASHHVIDWERVRQVSLKYSDQSMQKALEMGLKDEEECARVWRPAPVVLEESKQQDGPKNKPKFPAKKVQRVMRILSFGKKK